MKRNNKVKNKKSGLFNAFKDNKREVTFLVIGLVVGIVIMLILWPNRIAKLKDGSEVIVEINNKKFTADDLYTELKSSGGLDALVNLVDQYILYEKYDLDAEAEEFAKEQSEQIYASYETYYGYTKEQFLSSNGFKDEEEFMDYLRDEHYYQTYYDDYTATLISEDEINDFYKDEVFGDKDIYIFSASGEDNDLEGVRKYLKKGKTLDQIKKKYSNITANSYETVTFRDAAEYSETVIDQLKTLEKGEYSEVFEDSVYGYVVVYVVDETEKSELDKVKEDIIALLVDEKQAADSNIYYQAFIALREEYGIKFGDTEFKKDYEEQIKQYK